MADPWINRLVVAGPTDEVKAFAKAAVGFVPPEFGSSSNKPVRLALSFAALYKLLSVNAKRRVPEVESEPYDLISERLVSCKDDNSEKSYRFEISHYEPDLLLVESSKLFPRLCFILGWVAPNVGEAVSKFMQNGKTKIYNLPDKRRGDIRASKYEEWGDDCLDADIEADWLMLDEVVNRWDSTVASALQNRERRRRTRRMGRRKGRGDYAKPV